MNANILFRRFSTNKFLQLSNNDNNETYKGSCIVQPFKTTKENIYLERKNSYYKQQKRHEHTQKNTDKRSEFIGIYFFR